MSTRRLDLLIQKVRRETANEDWDEFSGIPDSHIVGYFNDALSLLERQINNTNAGQFKKEAFIDLVAGQEKYDLPDDYLASGGVVSVEYAFGDPSGSNPDWQPLRRITDLERSRGTTNEIPSSFQVVNRQLWIKSIPSQNKTNGLRVVYIKQLTRLSVRHYTVSTATLDNVDNEIDLLEATAYSSGGFYNLPEALQEHEYICIVDSDGTIKMKNIPLLDATPIDPGTGEISIRPGFSFEEGETIAVGDYVVFGKNASTHQLDLDENVEPFLCAYAAYRVMIQDSNTDAGNVAQELQEQAKSIMDAYARQNEDIQLIPEF